MQYRDKNTRPAVCLPILDCVPDRLAGLAQWIVWRFDWIESNAAWAKVPYDARRNRKAASNDPSTWSRLDDTIATLRDFDGIGFVFGEQDGLCGIDFDECVVVEDDRFLLRPDVALWIGWLDSYTEISVSGTGLHVIAAASVPAGRNDRKAGIEVYDRLRYFTFSGRSWTEKPNPINDRQQHVSHLYSTVFPERESVSRQIQPIRLNKSAAELLDIAFRARNGWKVRALYEGSTADYGGDDSAADLALCSLLAFYSGGDAGLLDQMFRGSRLYRDKWDERHASDGRTYGEITIARALAQCGNFYTGREAIIPRDLAMPTETFVVTGVRPTETIRIQ